MIINFIKFYLCSVGLQRSLNNEITNTRPRAKTINVFRACLGAQLTIYARNFKFSTGSLRFVLS